MRMFRVPTSRRQIRYRTVWMEGQGKIIPEYTAVIIKAFAKYSMGKAVIYCNTVKTTKDLAEALNCRAFYHHMEDKISTLEWFRTEGRIMVTTSAFGMGIDIANIRLIIHIGWPRTLLDYAQESGRAGRDGLNSEAIVVIRQSQFTELGLSSENKLVPSFVERKECKR